MKEGPSSRTHEVLFPVVQVSSPADVLLLILFLFCSYNPLITRPAVSAYVSLVGCNIFVFSLFFLEGLVATSKSTHCHNTVVQTLKTHRSEDSRRCGTVAISRLYGDEDD
jgi:hypothetical protein